MTQFKLLAFALGLASLALVLVVVSQAVPTGDAETNVRSAFKLPTLLDFQQYKRLFEKSYSDMVENLARAKLFLARAIRVFISAAKFRYKLTSFYLAINRMSDQAPHELDKMRNKVPARQGRSQNETDAARSEDHRTSDTMMAGDDQAIRNDFKEELEANREKESYEQLGQESGALSTIAHARMKRDVSHKPRQLISEFFAGVTTSPPFEPPVLGMVDQQEYVPHEFLGPTVDALNDFQARLDRLKYSLSGLELIDHEGQEGEDPSDEPSSDLRVTNCFFLPRDQGSCRGGYAFAAISLMEYQHCMKTGKLVAFSEQYVIDCGKAYFGDHFKGCHGGHSNYIPEFFHNFGLELHAHYPYRAREDACPYPADADLKTAGYLRVDVKNKVTIHISRWPEVLKYQPLLVDISWLDDFYEYGGGVHGWGCSQDDPKHVVLVLGYGQEDGHEYWLVRSSHGVGWGEAGHMKLAKRANCIYLYRGYTFGTNTGQEMLMEVGQNARYDASKVKMHYLDRMQGQPMPDKEENFVNLSE